MVRPYLCDELPAKQKEALHYGVKVPLVYTAISIKNWTSFHKLDIRAASCPGNVSLFRESRSAREHRGYKCSHSAEGPILVRMLRASCQPGLSAREQRPAEHDELQATPFETFERNIRDQLERVLGEGGFDPARDIDAITVNRWPRGYAYEYNPLWDPDWPVGQHPCDTAR